MKMRFFIAAFLVTCFSTVQATLRTDIKERPKEQVLKKSYHMGSSQKLSPVICHILVDGEINFTGIALDSYTILTCAHEEKFQNSGDIRVSFVPHVTTDFLEDDKGVYHVKAKPILHPSFRFIPNSKMPDIGEYEELGICFAAVPLHEWALLDFETYNHFVKTNEMKFSGVDLAILKLDVPLPFSEYPEILDSAQEIENEVALSLGYGPQKYNAQDRPSMLVGHMDDLCRRHLISTHVSAYDQGFSKVLYGHYKGLLVNGDESFIPDNSMLKTEGLPVCGDSGGPLLVKEGDAYKLAGILSRTWSICPPGIELGNPVRHKLEGFVQPIFPTWVDIRHYKDWIESHMGVIHAVGAQQK